MPQGPAARVTDLVTHPLPPALAPGPGSIDTNIGYLPAWRGIRPDLVAALQAIKQASDAVVQGAESAAVSAAGTPGGPAARTAAEAAKTVALSSMSSVISGMSLGADIHSCATPLPIPPHGPGVVIDGSKTVQINRLPACRQGDTILEALGPPNKIVKGCINVIIGG